VRRDSRHVAEELAGNLAAALEAILAVEQRAAV
jgi:hypothetical protein